MLSRFLKKQRKYADVCAYLQDRVKVWEDLLVAEGLTNEVIATFYGTTRGRAQLHARVDGVFRGRFE
jgi:hypothetical protein